jgi:hypothetical protein
MKKKSDLDNIFESYMKNIVLNEAVKPEEVNTPQRALTPQEEQIRQQKGWTVPQARIMFDRQNELKSGQTSYAQATNNQTQPTPQPTTQAPVTNQDQGGVVDSEGETWDSVETTTETIPNAVKTYQPSANANEPKTYQASSLNGTVGSQSNVIGNQGDTVTKQVIGSRPANAAGTSNFDGTTITSTPYAAGDDEFKSQDENEYEEDELTLPVDIDQDEYEESEEEFDKKYKNMKKVDEKNMIARFLKQLSEKNYSSSHKYLKTILEYKVQKALMREIGRI